MKKIQKTMLMMSAVLAVVGMVMLITGAVMGGIEVITSDVLAGKLSIGPKWETDIELFSDVEFDSMTSIAEKSKFDNSEVRSVCFEAQYGEFQIEAWDNNYYEIKSISESDEEKIKYSLEGGVLKLYIKGRRVVTLGNEVKAILYVPTNAELSELKINIGAGELNCNGLKSISQLFINVGAGEGTFTDLAADTVEMNVGAGDGKIENAIFGNADFKVGLGDLDVNAHVPGDINIDCGIGDMDLNLVGEYNEYNYKMTVGLGSVSIDDTEYSGTIDNESIFNSQDKNINVKCGIGDVSIDFIPN